MFQQKQTQSFNEPTNNKRLEIIGLEFGPKISSNPQSYTSIGPKLHLSRVNQTMLQLPKRTTFIAGRRAQENILPRYLVFFLFLPRSRQEMCTVNQ